MSKLTFLAFFALIVVTFAQVNTTEQAIDLASAIADVGADYSGDFIVGYNNEFVNFTVSEYEVVDIERWVYAGAPDNSGVLAWTADDGEVIYVVTDAEVSSNLILVNQDSVLLNNQTLNEWAENVAGINGNGTSAGLQAVVHDIVEDIWSWDDVDTYTHNDLENVFIDALIEGASAAQAAANSTA